VYVAKLNAAGEYQWAAQATGYGWDLSNGVALDGAGNVYITGYSESYELNFGPHKLTSIGSGATLYVAQLSPSGAWQRATLASSPGYTFRYIIGNALVVDGAGAVYVTGGLNGTAQFGATTLSNGGYGTFVAKLSPAAPGSGPPWPVAATILAMPLPWTKRATPTLRAALSRLRSSLALSR
jgi:hypothetical protein